MAVNRITIRDQHGKVLWRNTFAGVDRVNVSADSGVGTPSADSQYNAGELTITLRNFKGNGIASFEQIEESAESEGINTWKLTDDLGNEYTMSLKNGKDGNKITAIETEEQEGDEAINTVTIKTNDTPEGVVLEVRNGSRGNGIASSSEVLSPEDGGTNTHTITDTDGNEHVFHTTNGHKGDKGDQGDSAVYDPSSPDAPDFEMANTTGQSTTKTMTQKAVTDELLVVDEKLSIAGLYAQYQVLIGPSTGNWVNGGSTESCVFIPFSSGDILRIVPKSGKAFAYAPLKSDSHVIDTSADFCDGYTSRIVSGVDEVVTIIAPNDAHYLYILIKAGGNDQTPSVFKMKKVSSFAEDTQFEGQILRWHETPLNLLEYGTINGYINKNTNTWAETNSENNLGIYIPVVPGCTMRLYGTTYVYAFLKSTDTHTENSAVQYAGGATMRSYVSPQGDIREVPSDARYLFVQTKTGTDYSDLVKISILTSINDQVSNLSKDGAYMMPVDMIEEYPHTSIGANGTLYYYQPNEAGYSFNFCRKFPIVQGNDYYATARLGGSDPVPVVCYYDQNDSTIGFDPAFYPYRFPSGKVKSFFRQKMNVPSDAAYVIIKGSNVNVGLSYSPAEPALYIGSWQKKKDVTPYVIEYHEAEIRSNLLLSNKTTDPTSATEIEDTLTKSGWAVRWPSSYTPNGKPTQVIAMLHGYSGMVNSNVMGYYNNDNWNNWIYRYLSEGYAVIDVNGYGVTSGTTPDEYCHHYGCPAAVETLDKAFEYLKANYNVADKMFLHGTSMGGCLAQNYAMMYPSKVIAVGLFAPATLMQFAVAANNKDDIVKLWGYADSAAAREDDFFNFIGTTPFAKCLAWKDGGLTEMSWGDISAAGSQSDIISAMLGFDMIERFPLPVRYWQGLADESVEPQFTEKAAEGYRRGGSVASLRLVADAPHNMCVGSVQLVVDEAVAWFKRYGG